MTGLRATDRGYINQKMLLSPRGVSYFL